MDDPDFPAIDAADDHMDADEEGIELGVDRAPLAILAC
jgi:hypothetical protein